MLRRVARQLTPSAARLTSWSGGGGSARCIAGNDLSRKSIVAPTNIARTSEEQYFRDQVDGKEDGSRLNVWGMIK